jgi:hypothetical protein
MRARLPRQLLRGLCGGLLMAMLAMLPDTLLALSSAANAKDRLCTAVCSTAKVSYESIGETRSDCILVITGMLRKSPILSRSWNFVPYAGRKEINTQHRVSLRLQGMFNWAANIRKSFKGVWVKRGHCWTSKKVGRN